MPARTAVAKDACHCLNRLIEASITLPEKHSFRSIVQEPELAECVKDASPGTLSAHDYMRVIPAHIATGFGSTPRHAPGLRSNAVMAGNGGPFKHIPPTEDPILLTYRNAELVLRCPVLYEVHHTLGSYYPKQYAFKSGLED